MLFAAVRRRDNDSRLHLQQVPAVVVCVAGDGTTTATLLAEAIYREGLKNLTAGANAMALKAGVVDPAKVTRSALQNAASIAGLLLTTDCMVTDLPEKKESCGCGGHGAPGGMDGMM